MRYHKKSAKSLSLKAPRTPISAYRYAVTYKNVILTTIAVLVVVVVVAVLCTALLNPERQITRKFDVLASNYYENVFYASMLDSDNYTGDPKAALEKYQASGFSPVTLRQLIYLGGDSAAADGDYLSQYCDLGESSVTFYPEPPYSKSSYHTSITYACNF